MTEALDGARATPPIVRLGWSDINGPQLSPPSKVLHTPPPAAAATTLLASVGCTSNWVMRPIPAKPVPWYGPIALHEQLRHHGHHHHARLSKGGLKRSPLPPGMMGRSA